MNKADLVDIISEGTGLTKLETGTVIDAFIATVSYALANGERVELRRFGTFSLKDRKPKIGRNPKTGVVVPIPARKMPHFKPSPELRKYVEDQQKAIRSESI